MTKRLQPPKALELPPGAQIIYDQLMETHGKVVGLYPLIDLLSVPDDQKESLGERLALLLTDLTETLKTYQSQQAEMTAALHFLATMTETSIKAATEHRHRQEWKIDRILTTLNLPVD